MLRREFFGVLGGAATAWPIATHAQQVELPRIGFACGLSPESKAAFSTRIERLRYFDGRNVVIEWRYAKGDYKQVQAFVEEFVSTKVSVMVMDSTIGTEAAKRATSTIPVVMALVLDPVGQA